MGCWAIRPWHLCGGVLLVTLALTSSGSGISADPQKPSDPIGSAPLITPLELVQSSLARSRAILRTPATLAADPDERPRELRRVAHELFAFDAMARRALGPQWTTLSVQNQQEFLRLFTDMIERVYGIAVERYARDNVAFLGEKVTRPNAEVRSRLIARGSTISIDYRMLEQDSRWAVHDAVIDDISLVANYRSQFESIIRTSSFAELLDRMQRFSRAPEPRPGDAADAAPQKILVLAYLFSAAGTRK
jgi:phospholipid transport system substrate-binding protein